MVKRKVRKPRAPRTPNTRNANTMTESAFWSFIRSTLRQKSRWWRPIHLCKVKARRLYKGVNKRQKYEYKCNACKEWFPEKEINVDHIHPIGTLKCADDLPNFVNLLFCEVENLQCLCSNCHDIKTKQENEDRKKS